MKETIRAPGALEVLVERAVAGDRGSLEEVLRAVQDDVYRLSLRMLLCLDREHRLAYILGEVFELSSTQGGEVLQISPAAFRKRLSRARKAVRGFMQEKCGILNPASRCRCRYRVEAAIEHGRVEPQRLLFALHPRRSDSVRQGVREMESLESAVAELQRGPAYAAPKALAERIRSLLTSQNLLILEGPAHTRPSPGSP